jgi:hypothetical protein
MGYYLLHPKDTELCVDHLTERSGAEQAQGQAAGLAYVLRKIPTAESAVRAE